MKKQFHVENMKKMVLKKIKHVRMIRVSNYQCSWYDEIAYNKQDKRIIFFKDKKKEDI